jgi:outer membrane protein
MFKNKLPILLALVALVFSALAYFKPLKQNKFAYVDLQQLVEKYEGMKDVAKIIEDKKKLWKASEDTLITQFQNELKNYESEQAKMSEKERQMAQQLLQNKQQHYGNYQQSQNNKNSQEEMNIKKQALAELDEILKEIGKSKGYTMIIGATANANLVYAEEALNITNEVLEEANVVYSSRKQKK